MPPSCACAERRTRGHRDTEECFRAQLVLHLYSDKVAGVPQVGNAGISFTFI